MDKTSRKQAYQEFFISCDKKHMCMSYRISLFQSVISPANPSQPAAEPGEGRGAACRRVRLHLCQQEIMQTKPNCVS